MPLWQSRPAVRLVPSRDELVQTFLDVDLLETSALLAVIAAFSDDDMLSRRVRREISSRADALPRWPTSLRPCPRIGCSRSCTCSVTATTS
jgi:hypothetical protein